ncbi:MAG TPA: glycosyltransferase family 4 protein [Pseudolysinimonas sp.]
MTSLSGRRVAIVSRLYAPEPGAASFRLAALARALRESGAEVVVITARPPRGYAGEPAGHDDIEVRRAPVLRDRDGYVRGYLQYLSFDLPALFRMLFARRVDLVVNEPPPTTGVVTRIANGLRRRPYVYYAADIWSDAVAMTSAPRFVARSVRVMERWAVRGAAAVISASEVFTERMRELGYGDRIVTIGNGVDTTLFGPGDDRVELDHPYLLYAGTASEVHGAGIFLDAAEKLVPGMPELRVVFIGQGSERADLERRASALGDGVVRFEGRLEPAEVSRWIRGAQATLASVRPEGYHRAMASKMYASVVCGTPVVYAGAGPGREFAGDPGVGWAVDYDVDAVAEAMREALARPRDEQERTRLAAWGAETLSLVAVARRGAEAVARVLAGAGRSRARE